MTTPPPPVGLLDVAKWIQAKDPLATNYLYCIRAADTITRLHAELDAAREALKPFAAMGRLIESGFAEALFKDHEQIKLLPWTENGQTFTITHGDLRKARTALETRNV